jgi:uncharacterized protein YegP (UPF0339 family)
MFRPGGRAGRVMDEHERSLGRSRMSASSSELQFVIFRDLKDGYKWRLSSASGQTVEYSERGHDHKSECEHDVYRLKDDRYPYAKVRDAVTG